MQKLCERVAGLRLQQQSKCEVFFVFMNIFMMLFGFIWVVSGIVFVSLDMHDHYRDWVASWHAGITAFLVFFFAFVMIIGIFGYKLSKNEAPTKCKIILYAILIFFLVFIPFATYSGGLIVFRALNVVDDNKMCATLRREHWSTKSMADMPADQRYLMRTIFYFQRVDVQSVVSSQHMCTKICPCKLTSRD